MATIRHMEDSNRVEPSRDDDDDWRLHFMVVLGVGLLALAVAFMLRPDKTSQDYGQGAQTMAERSALADKTTAKNPASKDAAQR